MEKEKQKNNIKNESTGEGILQEKEKNKENLQGGSEKVSVDISDESIKERTRAGKISGLIGIGCNGLLAAGKIFAGIFTSSMSVLADGLNNLSDSASSIVTLVGFKMSEKPADKEHPYGHARSEYLAGLVVAMLILIIGVELVRSSVEKIFKPDSAVEFSMVAVVVMIISVLVKLWMMFFNHRLGKKIQSTTLLATAADSRNDVLTTLVVLLAFVIEHNTGVKLDGIMGLLVALFIIYSGVGLAKDTMSPLLGEGGNEELKSQVINYINSCPEVIGCHDLMVHDYGPGRRYATIHVEMDKNEDALACHDIIDKIERECLVKFETHLVVHYDPVIINDMEIEKMKQMVITILKVKNENISIHDFRMYECDDEIKLVFDAVIPESMHGREEEITKSLEEALQSINHKNYKIDITYDLWS